MQSAKILNPKLVPIVLGLHLLKPFFRHGRKHGDGAGVCAPVGKLAALGDVAKAVLSFTSDTHVVGIQSKDLVWRRVVAYPLESLHPRIPRLRTGPFDVCA